MRYIHIKEEIQKLFDQILSMKMKNKLIENMTKFQIASKPGHMPIEHLFVIFSIMSFLEMNGDAFILTMFDIRTMFDRENIYDCMYELYKREVRGKAYRLIFRMNETIMITVETPVGRTNEANTRSGIGQGTVTASLVSGNNIDGGIEEYFHEKSDDKSDKENETKQKDLIVYGNTTIFPMIFMDDVANPVKSVEKAQEDIDRMTK